MPTPALSRTAMQEAITALSAHKNNVAQAARKLGIHENTLRSRIARAEAAGVRATEFEVSQAMPSGEEDIEDLLDRRERQFQLKDEAAQARKLVDVRIKRPGPIAICHFGDPHVDDDGCDIPALRHTIDVIKATPGMYAANVGDLQNNWVGRLAHLYSQQSTSKRQAWRLTEWLVNALPWLYLVGGNHDAWSGEGDPLKWMMREQAGVFDYDGVRLNLCFPNGKQVRVNCRHDFAGHSQWNTIHGPMKAAKMGWRDHILTCGHKHTSGYGFDKDPATGLISHVLRVPGFKKHDRYASEKGLPDQAVSPTATTIIDPTKEDDDPELITVIQGVDKAAGYLTYLRNSVLKVVK